MNQNLLNRFGDPIHRVTSGIKAVQNGLGVLVADDENRENETDLIFPASSLTHERMAMLIRECSGIVCLCPAPGAGSATGSAAHGGEKFKPLSDSVYCKY